MLTTYIIPELMVLELGKIIYKLILCVIFSSQLCHRAGQPATTCRAIMSRYDVPRLPSIEHRPSGFWPLTTKSEETKITSIYCFS